MAFHAQGDSRTQESRQQAELLAIQALEFLAADGERLERFLMASGIALQQLRNAAAEPEFLAGFSITSARRKRCCSPLRSMPGSIQQMSPVPAAHFPARPGATRGPKKGPPATI